MILSLVIAWVVLSGIFFASLAIAASSPIPPMEMMLGSSGEALSQGAPATSEPEFVLVARTASADFGTAHS